MIAALIGVSALARADVACDLAVLTDTLPMNGASDVAVDALPLFIWQNGNCGIDTPVTVTLTRTGEAVPTFQQDYDGTAFLNDGTSFMLEPAWGTLEANTAYTVEIASPFEQSTAVAFTTGSRTAESLGGGVPSVSIDYAGQAKLNRWSWPVELELTLTSAGEAGGAFVLRDGAATLGVVVTDAATDTTTFTWNAPERRREVCITAVQRDETGAWHGPSDEVCAKVEGARGCSHLSSPWTAGWLLAPLLFLRRAR